MVNNISLNCQPLRLNSTNRNNKTVSFGAEKQQKSEEKSSVAANEPRKFSFGNAAKNFYKGMISPVVNLLEKPLALATTIGIGFGLRELSKKCERIGVLAVAATTAFGGFSIAKGIAKLVSAETASEKEKSFQDMGTGTLTIGLAALSAKPALKANPQIKTPKPLDEMNPLSRLLTCLKESKSILTDISKKGVKEGLGIKEASAVVAGDVSSATNHDTSGAVSPDIATNPLTENLNKVAKLIDDPTSLAAHSASETGALEAANNMSETLKAKDIDENEE